MTLQVQRMEDISVIKQLIGEIKDSIIGIEKNNNAANNGSMTRCGDNRHQTSGTEDYGE